MKKFWKAIGSFFKRFIPLWIILGVIGAFFIVDYVNYTGYKISVVKAYTDDNPEGDPNKLYFATPDHEETIKYDMQVTWFGQPKANHTLVGIGKKEGSMKAARQVTNENGICTFELSVYPKYSEKLTEVTAEILFYEETSAWIIEIQVRQTITTILHRRPVTND